MKISKLFHWLYAILMFLPIVFFGANVIQNIVHNTNADFDIQYKYETNEVNSNEDFIIGNAYTITLDTNTFSYIESSNMSLGGSILSIDYLITDYNDTYIDETYFIEELQSSNLPCYVIISDFDGYISLGIYNFNKYSYVGTVVDFPPGSFDEDNYLKFDLVLGNYDLQSLENYNFITRCENIPYEIIEVDNGITNTLYRSLESTFNLPIFEWARDSFLIVPFSFIGGLFGLSASNLIIVMLDYWLCISIIWLIFDIVMYFPLLIHRWLDKGVGQ